MPSITCRNCKTVFPLNNEKLAPYAGKTVSIICPNPECKKPVSFHVAPSASSYTEDLPTEIGLSAAATSAKSLATLIVNPSDMNERQSFEIRGEQVRVGRYSAVENSPQGDFCIHTTDQFMSKIHCCIHVRVMQGGNGRHYILSDMNSTNGTYLNDHRLIDQEGIYLKQGDQIRIGHTILHFTLI